MSVRAQSFAGLLEAFDSTPGHRVSGISGTKGKRHLGISRGLFMKCGEAVAGAAEVGPDGCICNGLVDISHINGLAHDQVWLDSKPGHEFAGMSLVPPIPSISRRVESVHEHAGDQQDDNDLVRTHGLPRPAENVE